MFKNVPDKYFESLKSRILDNVAAIDDDLKNNAPLLFKISKTSPYKVPDYYFSQSRSLIIKRTSKVRSLRIGFKKYIAAACIGLLIFISFQWFNHNESMDMSIAENEVLDYYIFNPDEIQINDIAQLSFVEDGSLQDYFVQFDDTEIEEYLSYNIEELDAIDLIDDNI